MPTLGQTWTPNFCEPCKNYGARHACRRCNTTLQPSTVSGRCAGLCIDCNAVYVTQLEASLRRTVNILESEAWTMHPDVEAARALLDQWK